MTRNDRPVVVFGGAGFIGSNWAHWLLRNTDARVVVYDNLSRPGVRHNLDSLRHIGRDRLTFVGGDIRDFAAVERVTRNAREIYHFAAQVAVTASVADPRHDFEVNLAGTFNILEGARKSGNNPFLLFTSTNKVYGNMSERPVVMERSRYRYRQPFATSESQPLDFHSPYGCSKGAADQYVTDYHRIYGLPTVVFRMSCISGPRQFGNEDQGWVAHFLYAALRRDPVVIFGDGRQVRDVLDVEDLVRAFAAVRAQSDAAAGEVYNIGGGDGNTISLLELIDEIEALTGKRLEHDFAEPRPGDQLIYVTDYRKLTQATGWRPRISVRQTLERIYTFWKSNQEYFGLQEPALASLPALPTRVQVA